MTEGAWSAHLCTQAARGPSLRPSGSFFAAPLAGVYLQRAVSPRAIGR